MKQLQTLGIVLSRTDYGEADRIVNILTPEQGKIAVMARGVRRPKSKLAGGIELFSVSDITYIRGKGEIGTLISVRLKRHFGKIIHNIERVQLGYEIIKALNRATEDQPESEYFDILEQAFASLDDPTINKDLIQIWFSAQLIRQAGHAPNLTTTSKGDKLEAGQNYIFDYDEVSFAPKDEGAYSTDDIKFLRLLFSGNQPLVLSKVSGYESLTAKCGSLVQTMFQTYIAR